MKKTRFWASYLAFSLLLLAACQSDSNEAEAETTTDTVAAAEAPQARKSPNSAANYEHWKGDYRPESPVEGRGHKMAIQPIDGGISLEIVLVDQEVGCNKRLRLKGSVSEDDVAFAEGECNLELRYKDGIIEITEPEPCFGDKAADCSFSGTYTKL